MLGLATKQREREAREAREAGHYMEGGGTGPLPPALAAGAE